jgi:hypothetical protein
MRQEGQPVRVSGELVTNKQGSQVREFVRSFSDRAICAGGTRDSSGEVKDVGSEPGVRCE